MSISLRRILGTLAVLIGTAIFLLSSGILPGLAADRQKNVSVFYPPRPEGGGVTLFLGPPVSTLLTSSKAEPIPFEFTNHLPGSAHIRDLAISPANCFTLEPVSNEPSNPVTDDLVLQPNETAVESYTLALRNPDKPCAGQHAATIGFRWTSTPRPQAEQAPETGKHSQLATNPSPVPASADSGQYAVSTSPIDIVTPGQRTMERFVHLTTLVGSAILIPIALAFFSYAYQQGQARRQVAQNRQARRLDVWKAVFPDLLKLIKLHYIPISRRMDLVRDQIILYRRNPTQEGARSLYAKILLLRGQVRRFATSEGGFYFRSKPGEELCGELLDTFWPLCHDPADEQDYSTLVERLFPPEAPIGENLSFPSVSDEGIFYMLAAGLADAFDRDPDQLETMEKLLTLIRIILNFECDRPLYPEWYSDPPKFPRKDFNFAGILAGPNQRASNELVQAYLDSIPAKCLQ